jgi:hypothetical protein
VEILRRPAKDRNPAAVLEVRRGRARRGAFSAWQGRPRRAAARPDQGHRGVFSPALRPLATANHPLQEVNAMLEYGRKLVKLSGEDDLVPGLALPTIRGGEWEAEAKKRDVREAFRTFIEESVGRAVRRRWKGGCAALAESRPWRRSALACAAWCAASPHPYRNPDPDLRARSRRRSRPT